jgi:hypothetical protein
MNMQQVRLATTFVALGSAFVWLTAIHFAGRYKKLHNVNDLVTAGRFAVSSILLALLDIIVILSSIAFRL